LIGRPRAAGGLMAPAPSMLVTQVAVTRLPLLRQIAGRPSRRAYRGQRGGQKTPHPTAGCPIAAVTRSGNGADTRIRTEDLLFTNREDRRSRLLSEHVRLACRGSRARIRPRLAVVSRRHPTRRPCCARAARSHRCQFRGHHGWHRHEQASVTCTGSATDSDWVRLGRSGHAR